MGLSLVEYLGRGHRGTYCNKHKQMLPVFRSHMQTEKLTSPSTKCYDFYVRNQFNKWFKRLSDWAIPVTNIFWKFRTHLDTLLPNTWCILMFPFSEVPRDLFRCEDRGKVWSELRCSAEGKKTSLKWQLMVCYCPSDSKRKRGFQSFPVIVTLDFLGSAFGWIFVCNW